MIMENKKTWEFEPKFSPHEQVWFIVNDTIFHGTIVGLKYETHFYKSLTNESEDKLKYSTEMYYIQTMEFMNVSYKENIHSHKMDRTQEGLIKKLLK